MLVKWEMSVRAAIVSPDNFRIATGHHDGRLRIWLHRHPKWWWDVARRTGFWVTMVLAAIAPWACGQSERVIQAPVPQVPAATQTAQTIKTTKTTRIIKPKQTAGVRPRSALKVGDPAPLFTAVDDTGKHWRAADHVGEKILVVYFYPADMTPGCTKQACGFRDDKATLASLGVEVVGVSGDRVRNHQLFKQVHNLNFTLLSDSDGAIARMFGVPTRRGGSIKRTIAGALETLTRGVTAARWTFVIDRNGKIVFRNTQVKAAEDSQAVIQFLKTMTR